MSDARERHLSNGFQPPRRLRVEPAASPSSCGSLAMPRADAPVKSCWRVWPSRQATIPFCGISSVISSRAPALCQFGSQALTTGAGASVSPMGRSSLISQNVATSLTCCRSDRRRRQRNGSRSIPRSRSSVAIDAGLYAQGIREGAPQAKQVADRFHLLENLREFLIRAANEQR